MNDERCRHDLLDGQCADCVPSVDPAISEQSRYDADHRSGADE